MGKKMTTYLNCTRICLLSYWENINTRQWKSVNSELKLSALYVVPDKLFKACSFNKTEYREKLLSRQSSTPCKTRGHNTLERYVCRFYMNRGESKVTAFSIYGQGGLV